jgi:hypothetical protein
MVRVIKSERFTKWKDAKKAAKEVSAKIKCSICGEDYAKPKRFEKGGDLYRGYIVRSYAQKDRIKAKVEVSLGYSAGFLY